MFILGDETRTHGRLPWVVFSLAALNVLVFCLQLVLGDRFTNGFALVPKEIVESRDLDRPTPHEANQPMRRVRRTVPGQPDVAVRKHTVWIEHARGPFPIQLTLFTSMFLHASWMHLIGNLWFLLAFGRNVESAMDHGRFLGFYVFCGITAGLVQVASEPGSVVPIVGASGAISGVMGAYVAIHPFNKVKLWMGWYLGVMEFPAIAVIGFWFLTQYLAAFASLEAGITTGVAYWAHLGGFLAGVIFVRTLVVYLRWKEVINPPPEEALDAADDESEMMDQAPAVPDAFQACLPPGGAKPPLNEHIQPTEPAFRPIPPLVLQRPEEPAAEPPPARLQPAKSPPAMPKPTVVLPVPTKHLVTEAPTQTLPKPTPLGELWSASSAKPRPAGKRPPRNIVLPVWQRPFGVPAFRPTDAAHGAPHSSAQKLNADAAGSKMDSANAFRERRQQMLNANEDNADLFTVCLPRKNETPADPFASFMKPSPKSETVVPPTVKVELPHDMTDVLSAAFDYLPPDALRD